MHDDLAPSRVEARFSDWMVDHGAVPGHFWTGYNLLSAGQLLEAVYADSLRDLGLSREEWRILVTLELVRESEPRRLAESLWLGRSTVVNAITRMEKRGLVLRERAANDRRLVIVRLTAEGERLAREGTKRHADTVNGLEWDMTRAEQETLAELARRFWVRNRTRVPKTLNNTFRLGHAER